MGAADGPAQYGERKEIIPCGLTLLFPLLEGLIGLELRISIHIDCHYSNGWR